jgi:hypothetical protein
LRKENSPKINPLLFIYKIGVNGDRVKRKMKNFLARNYAGVTAATAAFSAGSNKLWLARRTVEKRMLGV